MSFVDGMSAINLEMPQRVPRTEYSADSHWSLIKAVTGIDVNSSSDRETQNTASRAFKKAWNYDFSWNILIHQDEFGGKHTDMGHAVYAEDGTDYSPEVSQLFDDPEDVYDVDFDEFLGIKEKNEILTRFNAAYEKSISKDPDMVNMTGVYVTLMSGLIALLGWDTLLMAAGLDPKAFGEFTNRYAKWITPHFNALAECKAPVVMVHDDIVWGNGAFLQPDWYREYIFPNLKRLFTPLREAGKKIMFTSDGDFTMFIDDIADCGVNGFIMEPMTDMAYIAEKYGKTHVFIGNADTRILLTGTKEDIYNEVKRCMDIGKNCPGFFMAVGNHIPSNTPVDNALYYNEVYEKFSKR